MEAETQGTPCAVVDATEVKTCRKCGETKPAHAFSMKTTKPYVRRRGTCYKCRTNHPTSGLPNRGRNENLDPKVRASIRRSANRFVEQHPERYAMVRKAAALVFRAIQRGDLVRSSSCEECGKSGVMIEAAHYNYDEPLRVRWLCRSCHKAWDRAQPKTLLQRQ